MEMDCRRGMFHALHSHVKSGARDTLKRDTFWIGPKRNDSRVLWHWRQQVSKKENKMEKCEGLDSACPVHINRSPGQMSWTDEQMKHGWMRGSRKQHKGHWCRLRRAWVKKQIQTNSAYWINLRAGRELPSTAASCRSQAPLQKFMRPETWPRQMPDHTEPCAACNS